MFCRLHRLAISNSYDSEEVLPRRTKRHLERCTSCRDFRRQTARVHARLLRSADATCDRRLERRVLEALPDSPLRERIFLLSNKRMLTAAAMVMGAAILLAFYASRPEEPGPAKYARARQALVDFTAMSAHVTGGLTQEDQLANLTHGPLESELRAVTNQTRSAIRFLVACTTLDTPAAVESRKTN